MSGDSLLKSHPLSNLRKLREFLSQNRYWVDGSLRRVLIKEMDSDYLLATMLWLIDRAPKVKFSYELYYTVKGSDVDKLAELREMNAEVFIRDTPLFARMMKRYIALNQEDELIIPSLSFLAKKQEDDDEIDLIEDADGHPY